MIKRLSPSILLALAFLFAGGCKIKEFVLPSWDVELNVPLINQTYYVSDLIDSVNFFPAPGNNIVFQSSGTLTSDPPSDLTSTQSSGLYETQLFSAMNYTGAIPLGNAQSGMQIAYGLIAQGNIRYRFYEINPALQQTFIRFNEILDGSGTPLTINYTGNQTEQFADLSGYHIGTQGSDQLLTSLHYTIFAQSGLAPGSELGNLELEILSGIAFSSIRGRFSDLQMDIRENNAFIDIDYPGNIDQAVNVVGADMKLHISNPSTFPFILVGEFYAVNKNTGAFRTIDANNEDGTGYVINPAVGDIPGITEIEFADSVDYLLGIMPSHIELRNAYFRINNIAGAIGEINDDDIITGEYTATAPFNFILNSAPVTPDDAVRIEISTENRDIIRKNVKFASMDLGITNRLPVAADVSFYFGLQPQISPYEPGSWMFSKTAHVNAFDGNGTEQIVEVQLDSTEVQFFDHPEVFMQMEFRFAATDGPIQITASADDYIRVRSMISISAHVEEK